MDWGSGRRKARRERLMERKGVGALFDGVFWVYDGWISWRRRNERKNGVKKKEKKKKKKKNEKKHEKHEKTRNAF